MNQDNDDDLNDLAIKVNLSIKYLLFYRVNRISLPIGLLH